MKRLLLYIPVAIVLLLSTCFASLGCGGATGEQANNYNIENSATPQQYLENVGFPLSSTATGLNITLTRPTYQEMKDFLANDPTSEKEYVAGLFECRHFATEVDNNAKAAGWQCGFALLCYANGQHAVVAFNTSDMGIIFVEPQTDGVIDVAVGGTYQNQTIIEILIAW
jgi:hypothetical protein